MIPCPGCVYCSLAHLRGWFLDVSIFVAVYGEEVIARLQKIVEHNALVN
jgi:hypothetical protein